jgi:hypothetical protein
VLNEVLVSLVLVSLVLVSLVLVSLVLVSLVLVSLVLVSLVLVSLVLVSLVLVSLVLVSVVLLSGSGLGFSLGTDPTAVSEGTFVALSGAATSLALWGLLDEPPVVSSPPLALPTANEAPNRTTAAPASARRVRAGLTRSPSCAASWCRA